MERLLSRFLLPGGIAMATLVVALVGLLAFQEEIRGARERELRHVIATLEVETARLREELERQRAVVGAPDLQQRSGCFRPLQEMKERYPGRVDSLQFCYSLLDRLHEQEQR